MSPQPGRLRLTHSTGKETEAREGRRESVTPRSDLQPWDLLPLRAALLGPGLPESVQPAPGPLLPAEAGPAHSGPAVGLGEGCLGVQRRA